jgi:predicted amidohydrolase
LVKKEGKITIGMLKAMPAKWDVEGNWKIFQEQFRRHQEHKLDVFITPECFLDGYAVTEEGWSIERFSKVAQDMSSSIYINQLRDMARQAETNIVFGFSEMLNGFFYNCAVLIGSDGEIAGKYHKTHLQHHDRRFAPGQDLPVFDLDIGRAGIIICADRRWPESIRTLRLKGAEICLMPTYGMWHLDNEWWMRTRSYENQMFICFTHPNVSLITSPKGGIDAKLQSSVPDVLIHQLDLSEATDDNHLADRRPELYGIICDTEHPSRQKPHHPPKYQL